MAKPALGRGLGALLGGTPVISKSAPTTPPAVPAVAQTAVAAPTPAPVVNMRDVIRRVPLTQIRPCAFQPRKDFPPESLRELADSIREFHAWWSEERAAQVCALLQMEVPTSGNQTAPGSAGGSHHESSVHTLWVD